MAKNKKPVPSMLTNIRIEKHGAHFKNPDDYEHDCYQVYLIYSCGSEMKQGNIFVRKAPHREPYETENFLGKEQTGFKTLKEAVKAIL